MKPTLTPTRMRLSCIFVNVYKIAYRVEYTFIGVNARIPNGQPRGSPRGKARVSVESADQSARIVVRVRLVASWTGKSPNT